MKCPKRNKPTSDPRRRTILITGAARRLGSAIAKALAERGHFVVLHYHESAADAASLAQEIGFAGGHCGVIQADLSDRERIAALVPEAVAAFGPLHALVNNASSYHFDRLTTLNHADWDSNLRTNLEAPSFLTQAFAAQFAGSDGSIINILDFKVANLNPDHLSYTIAKVGLAGFTRLAAMEFHGRIRVNAIAPGLTLRSGKQTEAQFERAWRMTPLGRGPTQDEIGDAARFILETPSLNGQILCLDGGASLRPRDRDISVDPVALNG